MTRLPDFLIIGAAKSGTTTLYQYLCRHPQIYLSSPKEPDFFAIDELYAKGLEWYSDLFAEARADQVCGEASTTYTRLPKYPHAAERIAKTLPQVKLIYIMRSPIERAYSHHVHEIKCKEQVPKTPFEKGMAQRHYLVESSDYMQHIELYLRYFPRESLLLLLMEDLIEKPEQVLATVCQFIGVDDTIDLIQDSPVVANEARRSAEGYVRSRLTAPLKKIPGMKNVAHLFSREMRDAVYRGLRGIPFYGKWGEKQSYVPAPMLPETRTMLLERFRQPNQELAKLLERDLSHWDQL